MAFQVGCSAVALFSHHKWQLKWSSDAGGRKLLQSLKITVKICNSYNSGNSATANSNWESGQAITSTQPFQSKWNDDAHLAVPNIELSKRKKKKIGHGYILPLRSGEKQGSLDYQSIDFRSGRINWTSTPPKSFPPITLLNVCQFITDGLLGDLSLPCSGCFIFWLDVVQTDEKRQIL